MFQDISFIELSLMIAGAILVAAVVHYFIRPPRQDDADDSEAEK